MAARGLRRDAERVGDLGVRVALGHEPSDGELASGQRPPWLLDRDPAARQALDRVGAIGDRAESRAARRRSAPRPRAPARRRTGSCGSSRSRGPGAPRSPPRSAPSRPSRRRPVPAPRARSRSSPPRARPCPRPWSSAGPATSAIGASNASTARQVRRGRKRPAGGLSGADAGDHERHEQEPLARGRGATEGVLRDRERPPRVARQERHLGHAPERRQDHLERLGSLAELRGRLRIALAFARSPRPIASKPSAWRENSLARAGSRDRPWPGAASAAAASQSPPAQYASARCRAHHVRAVGLLDRVRVADAPRQPVPRGRIVHPDRRHQRRVAIAGHAERLEAVALGLDRRSR